MINKNKPAMDKAQLKGQVGENAVWDGPLDTSGFPMGEGSSSGITGMEVSKASVGSDSYAPITQRAKASR